MKRIDEESIRFGKRLARYRTLRGLSVPDLARQVGVAQSTYRDWENGRSITGQPYLKLARAFGIGLGELFGLENSGREAVAERLGKIEALAREIRLHL